MLEWKGAFLNGPAFSLLLSARAGVNTWLSFLTWSQPRTQGASEEWSDLDFFRVKFSIPSCWEWSGSSGLWLWAPSGAILKGGHRTAPCRSTINLGEEERDTSPDWPGPRRSKSKIYFSSLGLPANFRLNCLSSLFGWNRARSLNCFLWLEVFSGTKWLLLLLFFFLGRFRVLVLLFLWLRTLTSLCSIL